MLIKDSGSITVIAVAWALFSFIASKNTMEGTNMVPPPEPNNPLQKPARIPIMVNLKKLTHITYITHELRKLYNCLPT